MLVNAVDTCPFVFDFVPDQYKTQEMCDEVSSEDPFMVKCWLIDKRLKKCVIKLLILMYQY